jgi:hypothetical protein
VPTKSRWHPPPATVDAHADSAGEEYVSVSEVSKVMKAVKVMKVGEVVSWKERAVMAEPMHPSPSAGHVWAAEAVHTTSAVHAAEAVASHAAHHRVGRHRWRSKHRHHDNTSDCDFAEHDNSPDCPRAIVRTQYKMFK